MGMVSAEHWAGDGVSLEEELAICKAFLYIDVLAFGLPSLWIGIWTATALPLSVLLQSSPCFSLSFHWMRPVGIHCNTMSKTYWWLGRVVGKKTFPILITAHDSYAHSAQVLLLDTLWYFGDSILLVAQNLLKCLVNAILPTPQNKMICTHLNGRLSVSKRKYTE